MAIFNRIAPPAIGFAFVVNAFFCLTSHKEVFPFIFFANHLMVLFGFGVITSIATKKYKITSHTRLAIFISSMMFCAICIAATALQAEEYKKPLFDTLFGLSSACLVFSLVQHESMVARLSMPAWTLKLGDTSYALYLIHFPMVSILSKLSERVLTKTTANAWMSLILICATCILASMVFHQWIERPLLRRLTSKYSLPARQCQKTITKP
jgi:exopolysaccharide production protein ExoZ